jgi:hypothetical protein
MGVITEQSIDLASLKLSICCGALHADLTADDVALYALSMKHDVCIAREDGVECPSRSLLWPSSPHINSRPTSM